jgi:hypothetical protein
VVIRAVTGPLAIMPVFQIAPSRVITKQGSPLPRRSGDNVTRGRAGPAKVTLQSTLVQVVELMNQ